MIRERVSKRTLQQVLYLLLTLNGIFGLLVFSVTYPVEWRFNPSAPQVADAKAGEAPIIVYYREIKLPFLGSYAGTVRAVGEADAEGRVLPQDPYFDFPYATRPSFPYQPNMTEDPTTGVLVGGTINRDLCWWTGEHPKCTMPDPGSYVMNTCWELRWFGWARFLNILPSRYVCRVSNVFTIFAGDDIESPSE